MNNNLKVYRMSFASVYPHYVKKVEKKGRTVSELHEVIFWLTGYTPEELNEQIENKIDFENFFKHAPKINANVSKITGTICGHRIEEIEDDVMRNVRYLDKLVDELSKGRKMEKILRP